MPRTTHTAFEPLGATPWTRTLPFPIPDNQVGFAWKSAPPVTFHSPVFLAARRTVFFPIHSASLLQPPVLSVIAPSRV